MVRTLLLIFRFPIPNRWSLEIRGGKKNKAQPHFYLLIRHLAGQCLKAINGEKTFLSCFIHWASQPKWSDYVFARKGLSFSVFSHVSILFMSFSSPKLQPGQLSVSVCRKRVWPPRTPAAPSSLPTSCPVLADSLTTEPGHLVEKKGGPSTNM